MARSGNNYRLARYGVALTWLLRFGRAADGTHITNRYKNDGPGSQFCHTLSIQALCHDFGLPYAHTPFCIVTQKPHREFDQSRCHAWEDRLKLGEGFPLATDLDLPLVECDRYVSDWSLWTKPCIIKSVSAYNYVNASPNAFVTAAKKLRAKRKAMNSTNSSVLKVAVHMRRGDVDRFNHPDRYTEDKKVMKTIDTIRSVTVKLGLKTNVTLYSQGHDELFSEFSTLGIDTKLDGDPLDAFIAMQESDVLVTAKSTFSYLAGLTNLSGSVVYDPFWYPPLRDWILIGDQESANCTAASQEDSKSSLT